LIRGRLGFWLRLDREGFTLKHGFAKTRFRWSDIDGEFGARDRWVTFDVVPAAREGDRWRRLFTSVQSRVFGFNAGIDAPSLKQNSDALADLMNEWLVRWCAASC